MLNFQDFEMAVDAAGIFNAEALLEANSEADIVNFTDEQLKLFHSVTLRVIELTETKTASKREIELQAKVMSNISKLLLSKSK